MDKPVQVNGYVRKSLQKDKSEVLHKRALLIDLNEKYELNEMQMKALNKLVYERFPDSFDSYIDEWAERISSGRAYAKADSATAKVLYNSGLKEYVIVGYRKDGSIFDNYGSFSDKIDAINKGSALRAFSLKINDGLTYRILDAYQYYKRK